MLLSCLQVAPLEPRAIQFSAWLKPLARVLLITLSLIVVLLGTFEFVLFECQFCFN